MKIWPSGARKRRNKIILVTNESGDFGYISRNEKAIAEWKTLQ